MSSATPAAEHPHRAAGGREPRTGPAAGVDAHDAGPARGPSTPPGLVDTIHRIEASEAWDGPGKVVERLARAVAPPGRAHDVLTGTWLGHAVHPLLTDLPLGMWMSGSLLDFIGGRSARPAARRLIGVGVAAAVPTAATGLAEWLHVDRPARRVGVVHANANTIGLALYGASFVARRRGHHLRGVALGVAGGLAAIAGGYLGGHLTLARKAGSRDPRFALPAG